MYYQIPTFTEETNLVRLPEKDHTLPEPFLSMMTATDSCTRRDQKVPRYRMKGSKQEMMVGQASLTVPANIAYDYNRYSMLRLMAFWSHAECNIETFHLSNDALSIVALIILPLVFRND